MANSKTGSLLFVFVLAARLGAADENATAPDWSGLRFGHDTVREVERKVGAPRTRWKTRLERGVLDPHPTPATRGPLGIPLPRLTSDPVERIDVCVLDYGIDEASGARQWLIFRGDRLLYAILPPEPGKEDTVSGILKLHGDGNRVFRLGGSPGCGARHRIVIEIPSKRLAFLCRPGSGASIDAVLERVAWEGTETEAGGRPTTWALPEWKSEESR